MRDDQLNVKSFVERVRLARSANSKEIRLTISEAEQLSLALATMLAAESELAKKIMDLQQQILSAEIQQDGGKF